MHCAAANPSMRLGRFLFGFCLIWAALYASGAAQGGGVAYGLLALAITVAVAALWEHFAFATPARALLVSLGFGRPTGRSLLAGAVLSAAVLTFYPAYVLVSGTDLTLRSNWLWLAIGLFAYHGLAEELVWRGYAFRRLRRGRTFAAAIRRTIPLIAITHLPIVITNGPVVRPVRDRGRGGHLPSLRLPLGAGWSDDLGRGDAARLDRRLQAVRDTRRRGRRALLDLARNGQHLRPAGRVGRWEPVLRSQAVPGRPAKSSQTREPLVLWRQTWT